MSGIFKKMKIGRKLIVSFLFVTILSSCSGIVSLFLMNSADSKYSSALNNYGFSQGDIGLLMSALNSNIANILSTMATEDTTIIQQAEQDIKANSALISQYLNDIEKTLIGETERNYYNTILENLPEFTEHAEEVMALAKQNRDKEAMDLYQNEALEHINSIEKATQGLMDSNKTVGTQLSEQLTKSNKTTILSMSILVLVSISLSIWLALYISRAISKPMAACSERLVALSNGDLRSDVPVVDSQDETGILAEATKNLVNSLNSLIEEMSDVLLNISNGNLDVNYTREFQGDFYTLHTSTTKIIDSLNDAFGQINQSAEQVSSGSEQVSSGAQALSQGATEQASSVQELAATINEISVKVNNNATDAGDARDKANSVGNEMKLSNQKMQDMIGAMKRISDSSSEIGKIIKTIEDIAFQTNILALNAAVEAARAGAAGKGFAVVADEVRNLASKSSEASKSTSVLIENSIQAVEDGTKIADGTAHSLLSAVHGVEDVVTVVDRISTATIEQANALAQITQGVDQISSVVQTNSATAEESAAASEELSGQSQIMKDLVGKFKLKGDASGHMQNTPSISKTSSETSSISYAGSSSYSSNSKY